MWDLVIDEMKARDTVGRDRYGTPVQALNGRRSLRDAGEEVLDAAVYIRQTIEELKLLASDLHQARNHVVADADVGDLLDAVFVKYQTLLG